MILLALLTHCPLSMSWMEGSSHPLMRLAACTTQYFEVEGRAVFMPGSVAPSQNALCCVSFKRQLNLGTYTKLQPLEVEEVFLCFSPHGQSAHPKWGPLWCKRREACSCWHTLQLTRWWRWGLASPLSLPESHHHLLGLVNAEKEVTLLGLLCQVVDLPLLP